MAPISTLTVKLQAQIAEFQGEFRDAQKEVQKFHDNFQETATKASAYGNLIAKGVEQGVRILGDLAREILENASNIKDLSARTGLAVETIQRFQHVAEQTGTTVESFSDAAFRLGTNLAGGSNSVVGAIEALGLSFADLKTQSPDKQFEIVAEALGKMENASERNRLGIILMGRQFKEVAPAMAEGYKRIADEAQIAGRNQIEAIDGAGDAWARFKRNSQTILTNLAGTIINSFEEAEGALNTFDARFGGLKLLLPGNTAAVAGFADALRRVREEANNFDLENVIKEMQRVALMKLQPGGIDPDPGGLVLEPSAYKAVVDSLTDENKRWNKSLDESRRKADEYADALRRIREAAIPLTESQKDQVDAMRAQNAQIGDIAIKLKISADALRGYTTAQEDLAKEGLQAVGDALQFVEERVQDVGAAFDEDLSVSLKAVAGDIELVEERTKDLGVAFENDLVNALKFVEAEINGVEQRVNDIQFEPGFLEGFGDIDLKQEAKRFAQNAIGSLADAIVSGDWDEFKDKFQKSVAQFMGSAIAAGVNALVPGLGTLLQPLFSAFSEVFLGIFDRNRGRDLVEDFAASFGGFDSLHDRLLELGSAGEALWIKLTQGVGRNNPEQAAAVIAEIEEALGGLKTEAELAAARLDAIGVAMDGVNTKATLFAAPFQALIDKQKEGKITQDEFTASLAAMGEKGQAEFERIGVFAAAAFAGMVKETGDAIGALDRLTPALSVLQQGLKDFGLTSTGTIDALLGLFKLVHDETTGPILQAIQATGQIFAGLQDAGLLTADLFQTVSDDIGAAFRDLEAKGGDVAKAMALSQPILQRLWEAQQIYGDVTDDTTRKLLEQAEKQGLVGAHMKDVNQKILDVLLAIADVFGAKIPDSMRATRQAATTTAETIENEFKNIRIPPIKIPYEWEGDEPPTRDRFPSTQLASGGIVRRPTLALIGESGPEAVIPLNQLGSVAPEAGSTTVILQMDGRDVAEVVVPHIPGVARRYITV